MGEPSPSQTEVIVETDDSLIIELEKIESRHESATVTPTIFRVPTQLDNNYVSACKPMYISIGPYHRWESKLIFMEAYKLQYLNDLWTRIRSENVLSGRNLTDFIDLLRREMRRNESRARSCYSDPINMESDEFVEMMLLDGCFIIEFMFKLQPGEMTPPVISTRWGWIYVLRDLHLLENQLPFFVLESIYRMVDSTENRPRDALIGKLHNLLFKLTPFEKITRLIPQQTPDPDHLLHLFHLSLIGHDDHPNTQIPQGESNDMFYRKATELELSGVKFKTKEDGRLLHVRFHNGILEMSPLTLNEFSNTCLRNFVALEQCRKKYGQHFASYMFFIDNLVDSNKDVELLIKRGIFYNDMGSNEVVVKHFFDRFSNQIVTESTSNHLYYTLKEMETYCAKPWAKWRVKLFRDYFNNPWSILSFFAAVLLLLLTMVQTSGTIYSYIKN